MKGISVKLLVLVDPPLFVICFPALFHKESCAEFLHLARDSCFQRGNEGDD